MGNHAIVYDNKYVITNNYIESPLKGLSILIFTFHILMVIYKNHFDFFTTDYYLAS